MTINSFRGNYAWLSNYWHSPVKLRELGLERTFPTVEHAFQAAKVVFPFEPKFSPQVDEIQAAATPAIAKRLGQKVTLRGDWEDVKVQVMRECLQWKFGHRNPDLQAALLATRPHHLIEGNTWGDRFWGVEDGNGENMLGILLMEVRRGI
jgi:ribA/ribD-fused uncharacterized protein